MNAATAADIRSALRKLASPAKAKLLSGFFKTGPGQYGEGDQFLGITVPQQRALVKQFPDLPLSEAVALLQGGVHEERLTALIFMVHRYDKAKADAERAAVVKAYLANLKWVNNWDLVDLSAHEILGAWLIDKDRAVLHKLAASKVLWERRVSIVAPFHFIYRGESKETLALAGKLLDDEHDLMHKAVGWMLREVGKRVSLEDLRGFLKAHAATNAGVLLIPPS